MAAQTSHPFSQLELFNLALMHGVVFSDISR